VKSGIGKGVSRFAAGMVRDHYRIPVIVDSPTTVPVTVSGGELTLVIRGPG
jgi:hypothetical protein